MPPEVLYNKALAIRFDCQNNWNKFSGVSSHHNIPANNPISEGAFTIYVRKVEDSHYILNETHWEHINNKRFWNCLVWSLGHERSVENISYNKKNECVFVFLGDNLKKLTKLGECWEQLVKDSLKVAEEEFKVIDKIKKRDRTNIQQTTYDTIYRSLKEGNITGDCYILIWGHKHPWNHVSKYNFIETRSGAEGHKVNAGLATRTSEKHFVATKDPTKWSQESNFETKLGPLNFKQRIKVVDEFKDKLIKKGRSSNNVSRLHRYLVQIVEWYHGEKVGYWNTTPEYRHRWKRHVDWIIGSPATSETGLIDLNNPTNDIYDTHEVDMYYINSDSVVVSDAVEHNLSTKEEDGAYTVRVVDQSHRQNKKPLVFREIKCSCKETHKVLEHKLEPARNEKAISYYRKCFKDEKELMEKKKKEKEKEGEIVNEPDLKELNIRTDTDRTYIGRQWFSAPKPNEEEYELVTKKFAFKAKYKTINKNKVAIAFSNRFAILPEEELNDPMPHYLSPCLEDIITLNFNKTFDKKYRKKTPKEKSNIKHLKRGKKYKLIRYRGKVDRSCLPRRSLTKGEHLKCHQYKRRLLYRRDTLGDFFKEKGVTEEMVVSLKSRLLLKEKNILPPHYCFGAEDFEAAFKRDNKEQISVNYTKRQARLIMSKFFL